MKGKIDTSKYENLTQEEIDRISEVKDFKNTIFENNRSGNKLDKLVHRKFNKKSLRHKTKKSK